MQPPFLLCAAFLATLAVAPVFSSNDLRSLIPVGDLRVAVMVPTAPERCQELSARLQAAAQQDPEWWRRLVSAAAKKGGPLPYDPKMGLTQAEYQDLLRLSNSTTMQKISDSQLRIEALTDSVFRISAAEGLSEIDGIEIDLQHDQVRTSFGTTGAHSRVYADSTERSPAGRWSGVQWKLDTGVDLDADPSQWTGTTVRFCLGRLDDGQGILFYYNARQLKNGVQTAHAFRILYYALPR